MAQSVFGGVQEEDAQARQARAAAAAESRKERDAGRRKALARKVPVTAIMSQQQRCRVEQVLAQLRDAQQVSSNGNSAGECFLQLPTFIALSIQSASRKSSIVPRANITIACLHCDLTYCLPVLVNVRSV